MYHATSPRTEFRAGCSQFIKNRIAAFLLGTSAFLVVNILINFFSGFAHRLLLQKIERRLGVVKLHIIGETRYREWSTSIIFPWEGVGYTKRTGQAGVILWHTLSLTKIIAPFFSVHLLSLVFSTKQPFLLSLRLIGCIANIAPVSGNSMLSSYV